MYPERIGVVSAVPQKRGAWLTLLAAVTTAVTYFRLPTPHPAYEKYLPMYNLQQQYIEKYLHDAVAASDLIDMRWQSELAGIERHEDGVSARITSPAGDYRLDADYVLAADGARSPIRSMLGLAAEGRQLRRPVCDRGYPHGSRFSDRAPRVLRTERQSRRHGADPQAAGRYLARRLSAPRRRKRGRSPAGKKTSAPASARSSADVGHTKPWELEWWSVYSANTLCLDDYRHGRVFFIGDAAHIVPIFGVRGLNNGLADAENIGWKLALVLHGEADDRLLDSYSPERRGATLDVFANATKSTRFMTPPTRGWRLAREAALSLSLKHEFPRGLANPRQMQPYTYSESPLTPYAERDAEFAGGPGCGSVAPNAKLADGSYLLDHAGNGMTAILFCDGAARPPNRRRCSINSAGSTSASLRWSSAHAIPSPAQRPLRTMTAKSPACSPPRPARSICCGPTCTLPGDGRPSSPARS